MTFEEAKREIEKIIDAGLSWGDKEDRFIPEEDCQKILQILAKVKTKEEHREG